MLTSKTNASVKLARKLHQKKHRDIEGLFLLEGRKFVSDALTKGFTPQYLFYTQARQEGQLTSLPQAFLVSEEVFASVSQTATPQGVLAIFPKPDEPKDYLDKCAVLYLDGVQDSDNAGALIRSADAAGFDLVILNKTCGDPFSPKAVRASAGSILNIPILCAADDVLLEEFRRADFELIGAHLKGEETATFPRSKNLLIVGSEGNGMSGYSTSLCTKLVRIPLYGGAESLNASVSGAILMYKIKGY